MIALINMDQLLQKLGEQAPSTLAVIITVIIFIRAIKDERESMKEFFRSIHSDNLQAREQTRIALEKNSSAMTENVIVTVKNTDTLERLARAIERCDAKSVT